MPTSRRSPQSGPCSLSTVRVTRSSARRAGRPAAVSCGGLWIRLTARSTFCSGFRHLPSASPARTRPARSPGSCSTRLAASASRRRAPGEPQLNGEQIHSPERDSLATAMVATGFSYDAGVRARQAAVLARVLPRVRDIRRFGAAALDLCWCACGRFDGYYERGLHAWDIAAGSLIAQRAGLEVRPLPAAGEDPEGLVVAPAGADRRALFARCRRVSASARSKRPAGLI